MIIKSEFPEIHNIELSETNFKITMLNMFYKVKDKLENNHQGTGISPLNHQMEILEHKNIINKTKNTTGKLKN